MYLCENIARAFRDGVRENGKKGNIVRCAYTGCSGAVVDLGGGGGYVATPLSTGRLQISLEENEIITEAFFWLFQFFSKPYGAIFEFPHALRQIMRKCIRIWHSILLVMWTSMQI